MLVVPSPKSHAHAVTFPVVVLANITLRGALPLAGVIVKLATGAGTVLTLIGVAAVLIALPPGPVAVSFTV